MAKKLRQLYGSRKPKSYRPAHNHVIHTPSFAHSLIKRNWPAAVVAFVLRNRSNPARADRRGVIPMDLQTLRRALGGDISNGQLLCPGPGHSPADRSLSIKLNPNAPDGFVVHSFSGDDPLVWRDHVRKKLGLPEWKPKEKRAEG